MPDVGMSMLRAVSLIEKDDEDIAEMFNGATAGELLHELAAMIGASKALVRYICEAADISPSEFLECVRERIAAQMPRITHEAVSE